MKKKYLAWIINGDELNTKAHDHTFINGGKTERFHLVGSFEAKYG